VERELTPGLVDLRANLQYSHEVSVNTGIIVSADGLVLTSNNDIIGATSVTATLVSTGRTYTARVLGYDATQDVALLKLEGAAHLSAVTLGNSSQVTIGMPVLALGNAQGQGGVTPAAGDITPATSSQSAGPPSTAPPTPPRSPSATAPSGNRKPPGGGGDHDHGAC
jgi:S1-C subfamily serine protease